jgi:hypothetical protein
MTTRLVFLLMGLLAAGEARAAPRHFEVRGAFVPASAPGKDGAVAVTFVPLDPDVHINEEPAPRLELDPAQAVLVDKQKPGPPRAEAFDPEQARYLDLSAPVLFSVALSPGAPKGDQTATAQVVYFYCSKREGWCRKGTAALDLAVNVP